MGTANNIISIYDEAVHLREVALQGRDKTEAGLRVLYSRSFTGAGISS